MVVEDTLSNALLSPFARTGGARVKTLTVALVEPRKVFPSDAENCATTRAVWSFYWIFLQARGRERPRTGRQVSLEGLACE